MKTNLIIDFDSTFVTVETLEEIANVVLANDPEKSEKLFQIKTITDLGMEGEITFQESLKRRLQLLRFNKEHIRQIIDLLKTKVTKSFERNKKFFLENADNIYILSGGFREMIIPVVEQYGIKPENILAIDFIFDDNGYVIDINKDSLLLQDKGKVKAVESLELSGNIYMIGDGMTDYQVREAGIANKFFAFCENIHRDVVATKADLTVNSFDDILASYQS